MNAFRSGKRRFRLAIAIPPSWTPSVGEICQALSVLPNSPSPIAVVRVI